MWRRLGFQPGEGGVLLWGATTLALVGWADVAVKNASETLFNKRVGVEHLPQVFLLNALLLVATTYAFGRIAARSDRLRLLPRVLGGLGVLLLPLWALVLADVSSAYTLLVLASKQLPSIVLLVFWIAMADLLTGRQAKRLFAPMMAGLTLGAIPGSFFSEPIGRALGIENLVASAAVALMLAVATATPLRRAHPRRLERTRGAAPLPTMAPAPALRAGLFRGLWRESGLFRLLFVTSLCAGLLGPMLYFQFQYVADAATTGEGGENRLLAFYSQFRGWIYVAVLPAQLFATTALYGRIGVPLAAAFSPALYLLGFLGLSVRLSLPAGVFAMAGTKLQDSAVYDPAQRILYSLFPEALRSRASALLEGPVKRAGGALGNVGVLGALALGSAVWVGYVALPIALLWLLAALRLWRAYPNLLLQASAAGRGPAQAELLDPATVRVLGTHLLDPDPARCRAAIELVCEAQRELAVVALARAARDARAATRPQLVAALDRLLEDGLAQPLRSREAAEAVADLLAAPAALGERDRADLVQAYGRLTRADPAADLAPLERARNDPGAAVRLAAVAALHHRGVGDGLARELAAAVAAGDATARRTAREELRAMLLCDGGDAAWPNWLDLLVQLLDCEGQRDGAAEALADVAARHGAGVAAASRVVFALRDDPDESVRASVLRFAGHAGLEQEIPRMIEALAGERPRVAAAAREGLLALGPTAVDLLLVELGCGKRRTRDAILPLLGELEVRAETLRELYESELETLQRILIDRFAVAGEVSPIVLQRLEERLDEGSYTALLLLAAIRGEERIADLGDLLRHARDRRQRAVLVEALEASVGAREKPRLIPLLEDRDPEAKGRRAARALGIEVPSPARVAAALLEDPDELTRTLAAATRKEAALVAPDDVEDHERVPRPVEIALLLKSLPVFERLTVRQLMDLAGVVHQESHPPDSVIVREGEYSDGMYVIVEGSVHITKEGVLLSELGPRDFFGEIAVLEGSSRTATARSRDRVRLLVIRRDDLLRLMEELPAIAIRICESLSHLVRKLSDRVVH